MNEVPENLSSRLDMPSCDSLFSCLRRPARGPWTLIAKDISIHYQEKKRPDDFVSSYLVWPWFLLMIRNILVSMETQHIFQEFYSLDAGSGFPCVRARAESQRSQRCVIPELMVIGWESRATSTSITTLTTPEVQMTHPTLGFVSFRARGISEDMHGNDR